MLFDWPVCVFLFINLDNDCKSKLLRVLFSAILYCDEISDHLQITRKIKLFTHRKDLDSTA